ncbi:MAG: hypothetical protein IPH33_12685 [Bacteroidetes bacterium]|nr:hypothetical protein [Bacteroidota bacterium]
MAILTSGTLYLGDPAIKLAYPEFSVKTKTINGIPAWNEYRYLKAFSKITITREVQDNSRLKNEFIQWYNLPNCLR